MERTNQPGRDDGGGSEGMEPSHSWRERGGRLAEADERVELPLDEGVWSGDECAEDGGLVSMRSVELAAPIAYFPFQRPTAPDSFSLAVDAEVALE